MHLLPFYDASNKEIDIKYIIKLESTELKEIDIKNRICYYFDDLIKA